MTARKPQVRAGRLAEPSAEAVLREVNQTARRKPWRDQNWVAPEWGLGLAGPWEEGMPSLVRRYLNATGNRRPVMRVTLPGAIGRVMRDGGLLPASGTRLATQTFDQWLAAVTAEQAQR